MSTTTDTRPKKYDEKTIVNFPNQVTTIRLMLSIALFVLLHFQFYFAGFWLFLIAAGTDWLDGFWARRYGQITILGRMLDPFVDKVIICGTYIFLAAAPHSGLVAWMAVLVLGRELLVTALRSFLEQQGADFSASISGKAKFILQCAAASASLWWLSYGVPHPPQIPPGNEHAFEQYFTVIAIWSMIAITIYSGYAYVRAAIALIRRM
jgi:CDP-diacylglycerol---glycerol-3-phosphate 3-phosphatidyltransferase